MPMQAIRISADNWRKILDTKTSIEEFDIGAMINDVDEMYYIPRWDETPLDWPDFTAWATVPEPKMSDIFIFDKDKAQTDFVEIDRRDR